MKNSRGGPRWTMVPRCWWERTHTHRGGKSAQAVTFSRVPAMRLSSCWIRGIHLTQGDHMATQLNNGFYLQFEFLKKSHEWVCFCQWLIYAIPVMTSAFFSPRVMYNPEQEASLPAAIIWLQDALTESKIQLPPQLGSFIPFSAHPFSSWVWCRNICQRFFKVTSPLVKSTQKTQSSKLPSSLRPVRGRAW